MSSVGRWQRDNVILFGTVIAALITVIFIFVIYYDGKTYNSTHLEERNLWLLKFQIVLVAGHCAALGGLVLAARVRFHPPLIVASLLGAIWPTLLFMIIGLSGTIPWWIRLYWSALLIAAGPVLLGAVASTTLVTQRKSNGWHVPLSAGIGTFIIFLLLLSMAVPPT